MRVRRRRRPESRGPPPVPRIPADSQALVLLGLAVVKVSRTGNSLVVRIPANLARFLKLRGGEEALIRPEGQGRIVVELT